MEKYKTIHENKVMINPPVNNMNHELYVLLQIHLGCLLEQLRKTYEWTDKRKIVKKINAVEELLDIELTKQEKIF